MANEGRGQCPVSSKAPHPLSATKEDVSEEKIKVTASIVIDTQGVKKEGRIKHFINVWREYTSDSFVLESVTGCKINFVTFPRQAMLPRPLPLRREEMAALQCMIKDFLRDGVIVECHREDNDYVNTVFLRAKRDIGDGVKQYKMILKVKELNHHVQYIHFKMDSLESC